MNTSNEGAQYPTREDWEELLRLGNDDLDLLRNIAVSDDTRRGVLANLAFRETVNPNWAQDAEIHG